LVVFRFVSRNQKTFFGLFWFVSVFRTGIETTETNRIFLKQTETNRKNLQKTFSIRGSSKLFIFFSVQTEKTETQSVSVDFRFAFSRNQKMFFSVCFGLFRCFGPVSKQPKQTKLMVWGNKKVDNLTNLLLFQLVFCLFRLFRNTETSCFDIKAKQPKQTSCFG
jgi:hypothetical protein